MSILILKNVPEEGPGTIEDFLYGEKKEYRITDLSSEDIPEPDDFDILVILGGHMSVNDADRYPFIHQEMELVRNFILKKKRVLGICLGAQIMASAFGAKVYPGTAKEIGWYDLEPAYRVGTDSLMDSLMKDSETGQYLEKIKVFQFHGETFDIPEGGVRIAASQYYPNQAFRYGDNSYAFQFHIEVKKEMIYHWLKNEVADMDSIKKDTGLYLEESARRALNFYKAFFGNKRELD
jgi:GMP synthase (glutamine-hydrolysing)